MVRSNAVYKKLGQQNCRLHRRVAPAPYQHINMREFKSGDGRSARLWELDDAISKLKEKIAEYKTAVVKGNAILEELNARRTRLLNGEDTQADDNKLAG